MKKFLFTCFLALLCLAGSPSSAQSKVAESPGADLLHRSGGPHRGGETRSDTSPPGFSLVDDSTSPRQKGGIPSARVEEGMLYIEVTQSEGLDTLSLRFWDHLVSERMNVTPGSPIWASGAEGNMFEGSRNFRVFAVPFPRAEGHGYFNVGSGRSRPIRQWIYFPEDRVRIRADLSSGVLLFGGPDAAFYRLQHEVDRAFGEEQFDADPILFSADREFYRSDSLSERLWSESRGRPDDLYVRMHLISDADGAWKETEKYMAANWTDHPALAILDRYGRLLSAGRISLMEAAIKGQLLYTGMSKAKLAWPAIRQDPSKLDRLGEWVAGFGLDSQQYSHPLLAQGFYQFALMDAQARQVPIEQVYASLPNPLREEVIAFYILDNFNRMEDRLPEVISQNLPLVESVWITRRFEGLLANAGAPFSAGGIYLQDGSQLRPEELKGKTVLIHYWISGCRFCIEEHQRVMADLSERYRGNGEVLVLTVNADARRENWIQSLATGKYASASSLNAWVPQGTGILKSYSVYSFPQKMVIAKDGTIRLQSILRMEQDDLIRRLEQDDYPTSHLLSPPNP